MSAGGAEGDAVVVPAVASGSSVTCVRSLGRRGVHTIAAAADASPPSTRSRYCGERRSVPSPYDDLEGYADGLLDLARRPDVRTVVPLREPDVYVLSKRRGAFAEYVAAPWPDFGTVRTVQDRRRLLATADRADVDVPAHSLADEWDRWDETTVVKSRYAVQVDEGGASYPGVRFLEAGERPDLAALVEEMGHVPLAQEYVPGDGEFGFFALYDRGDPVATFQHRRVRSYDYAGGASVYRRSVDLPELAAAGRRLLDELEWHGPGMVEFKRDPRDGSFRLMEVNPRFWGSLALPVAAGVDFPHLYYRLARGDVDPSPPDYETGVGCHVLVGEVSYLYSVLAAEHDHVDAPPLAGEVATVGRSLLSDPTFDYLSVRDPMPFLSVFGSNGRDALDRLVRALSVDPGRIRRAVTPG